MSARISFFSSSASILSTGSSTSNILIEGIHRQIKTCAEDVWTEEQSDIIVGSLSFWVRRKAIVEDLLVLAGDNYCITIAKILFDEMF